MLFLAPFTTNTLEESISQLTLQHSRKSLYCYNLIAVILRFSTAKPLSFGIITLLIIMSSIVLLFLLLCLSSLHACNARILFFSTDEQISSKIYHFAEDVGKVKPFETSSTSKLKPSIPEEYQTPELQARNNERFTHQNRDGTVTTSKQKISNVSLRKHESTDGEDTESEITKSFAPIELQQSIKEKGLVREHARSMLGSAPHDTEEALDFKENDAVDDEIVVMDYAQPHRKPPIHNEKP